MKNKDKSREIVKIGIHKHLLGVTLKEIDLIYEKYFKDNKLSIREKGFVKNLTLVSIRNRGVIEYIISKYLNRPLPKNLIEIKAILIMGVSQIIFTRTENYAAVNTTVDFFYGKLKKWRGLANAILRKIIREEIYKNKKYDAMLNIPEWIYKIWKNQFGEIKTKNIIKEVLKEPYLDIRIKKDYVFWKKKIGGEELMNSTLRLQKTGDVKKIKGYKEGAWWVQNIAAQIPVMLCNVLKNEEVLDLCSAPGGKTAQLLNKGAKVISLDISEKKNKKLLVNMIRLKLEKNLSIITADLLKWDEKKKYNKILLDVPCSATGTIRKNPDVLWNKTKEDIIKLSKVQKKLLNKAISLLNEKGILIYCSCSLQYDEGEKVIDYFIKKNKVKLLPIKHEELKLFPKEIINKGLIRTLPYMYNNASGLDGFFIARLIKI
jgi:16S rRNA (cytosine967-C5)-methyltransferase